VSLRTSAITDEKRYARFEVIEAWKKKKKDRWKD
jgi:hypothetical protein